MTNTFALVWVKKKKQSWEITELSLEAEDIRLLTYPFPTTTPPWSMFLCSWQRKQPSWEFLVSCFQEEMEKSQFLFVLLFLKTFSSKSSLE